MAELFVVGWLVHTLQKKHWNKMHVLLCVTLLSLAMAGADENRALSLMREANDQFSAKMFSEVAKSNSKGSFVLSAYSVMTPLSLLSIASEGKTHDELLTTLGFQNDEVLKEAMRTVTSKLRSIKGLEIKSANRIYIPLGYELNDDFAKTSKDVFDSEVKQANFADSGPTVAEINGWVEAQTNNKIKDLVNEDQVNSDTRAMLVNALYFKGLWKDPFVKLSTKQGTFYKSKTDTTEVSYMNKAQADCRYAESSELNAKILELPYAGSEAFFRIILPNEVNGLDEVEAKIKDQAILKQATSQLYDAEVNVKIPKFKIETKTDLLEVLKKVGIEQIFGDQAEITKLLKTREPLSVTSATQKAFIEVNEEGTEAAAANEFGISLMSAFIPEKILEFKADHPFIFMVKMGDLILFSGVYKP